MIISSYWSKTEMSYQILSIPRRLEYDFMLWKYTRLKELLVPTLENTFPMVDELK